MNNDDWDLFKKTVNPLKNRRKFHLQTKIKPKATIETRKNEDLEIIDIVVTRDWGNLEKNILKKIQKKKIKVSASLDLHGSSLKDSKKLVFDFINNNYEKQNRLLLLITGKGKRVFLDDQWRGIGKLKSNTFGLIHLHYLKKLFGLTTLLQKKVGKELFLYTLKNYKINLVRSVFL